MNCMQAEQADKANQSRARWFYCALSKRPLQEPIVSCALGKLYNKDALLEYLLDKSAYGDGDEICGHVKSLKDVKTLKLTPNPTPANPDSSSTERPQFVCPLTLKEMNGGVPFVYIATCGCVVSLAGLKALAGSTTPSEDTGKGKGEKEGEKEKEVQAQLEVCPQCGAKYERRADVRMINPDAKTEETMREAMEVRARVAKVAKSSKALKKRKAPAVEGALPAGDEKDVDEKTTKKARSMPAPSLNPSIVAASRAVASSLALEEAKRKAGMSDAVRSLYESNGRGEETFMTRTFNRYA
ncbi:hypothetical protein EW145_g1227 [Phellinidium pouzarii]|uniref:Uncharacterized protein n=1 Tax=Phellinidium pouzarii TaxID=167371 RepID=A0A4S4LFA4_9AGAM|nr:hypothetical protein EW145_g1227 [Phellinidium pouzarii]